uniref:Uncharacterized protein n=1 Tax=Aegilops tauschii TaxID=37682 RepID=M8CD79_AEGTA
MACHRGAALFLLRSSSPLLTPSAEAQEASSDEAQLPPRPLIIQLPTAEEKRAAVEAPTTAELRLPKIHMILSLILFAIKFLGSFHPRKTRFGIPSRRHTLLATLPSWMLLDTDIKTQNFESSYVCMRQVAEDHNPGATLTGTGELFPTNTPVHDHGNENSNGAHGWYARLSDEKRAEYNQKCHTLYPLYNSAPLNCQFPGCIYFYLS